VATFTPARVSGWASRCSGSARGRRRTRRSSRRPPGRQPLAHNASHQALSAAAIRADSRRHEMTHGEQFDEGEPDYPAAACGGDDVGRKARCEAPSQAS